MRYYFVQNGVDVSRIEAKNYGEKRHFYSNDTTFGRGKNRRVVIQMQNNNAVKNSIHNSSVAAFY